MPTVVFRGERTTKEQLVRRREVSDVRSMRITEIIESTDDS